MYATLAVILTLLAGTGTAFAAENTLPGDSLYPVKVHVNENVRGAVALGSEAKADWEARKAERRLEEAANLAAHGSLSAEAEADLQARFETHTEKVKNQIAKLQENGNVEAAANLSSRLESALEIHEDILLKIHSEDGVDKDEVKPLLKELKNEVKEMNKIRTKIDADIEAQVGTDAKVAAENRMEASLRHINEVRDYLEDKDVNATSSAMLKLDAAVKLHAEGKTELDAGNYAKAFILFGQAQRLAQEAKVMIHVRTDIKLDARVDKIFEKLQAEGIELDDEEKVKIENRVEGRIENRIEDRLLERRDEREDRKNEVKDRVEDRPENIRDQKIELRSNGSANGVVNIL